MSFKIAKTGRKKGIRKPSVSGLPTLPKLGSLIKTVPIAKPKLPKLKSFKF